MKVEESEGEELFRDRWWKQNRELQDQESESEDIFQAEVGGCRIRHLNTKTFAKPELMAAKSEALNRSVLRTPLHVCFLTLPAFCNGPILLGFGCDAQVWSGILAVWRSGKIRDQPNAEYGDGLTRGVLGWMP